MANLSFSYSKMSTYKECPQKYKFRYILKIPEKPKYYFAFGTALHKVMEFMYANLKPPFPPLEETLKFFRLDWQKTSFADKGYASAQKELEGYEEGVRIIEAYYKKHEKDIFNPLSTEFRTTQDIDGLSIISIVDRIDYLGEGKVSILDYKTGKTVKREPDQLLMYQKLMGQSPQLLNLVRTKEPKIEKVDVASLLFYYLPKLEEQNYSPAPKEEIDEFWQGVLKVADSIKKEKFAATPSELACKFCDYRDLCPVYKNKKAQDFEQITSEDKSLSPLEALAKKIDELGTLQTNLSKLKQEVIKEMQVLKLQRHFGKEYNVILDEQEHLNFTDEKAVIDLLKKEHLLNKTLVPTLETIEDLFKDSKISEEQKRALAALATKNKTCDLKILKDIEYG
jgi:RecB family exonuclease